MLFAGVRLVILLAKCHRFLDLFFESILFHFHGWLVHSLNEGTFLTSARWLSRNIRLDLHLGLLLLIPSITRRALLRLAMLLFRPRFLCTLALGLRPLALVLLLFTGCVCVLL